MRTWWLWFFAWSFIALADTGSDSEFQIDPGLLNDLYRGQVKEVAVESRYRAGGLEIEPSFSYLSPQEFSLKNDYFTVPYGPDSRLPLVKLTFSTSLYHWEDLTLWLDAGAGYGFREAVYDVEAKSGIKLQDLITLHFVPFSAGLRVGYVLPFARWVKPIVRLYGGAHWLQQSGRLDGITQAYWIPFYGFSGGINFFDLSTSGESWFGGVTVSGSKQIGTGSQKLTYSSWDLAATLVL